MDCIDFKKVFDELLEDYIQLLKIKSVYDESTVSENTPYGKGVDDALEFMKHKAIADGFDVLEYDHQAIAIRYKKNCSKRIDIASHLDVVEPGDGWKYDPFGAVIEDGKVYARGTQDMKTSAWLTYLSLKLLREKHPDLDCEVRIVLGTDEERTMNDLRHYVKCAGYPNFAFTPDGYFPMGIGEKGALMWRLKGNVDSIVEELNGGVQCNVIAPHADAILKDSTYTSTIKTYIKENNINASVEEADNKTIVKVKGKAAHASRPYDGHNATVDLLGIIGNCCNDKQCKELYECFKDPYGKGCECDYEIEPMGKVTINLGVLRINDGNLYAEVDCRYPYGVTSKTLSEALQKHLSIKVSLDYDDKPTLCEQNDPYVLTMLKTYRDITGDCDEPLISGGVSYSKVFEHCVSYGPGRASDEHLAHQANEYVVLDECGKYLEIYYKTIEAIASIEEE